MKKSINKRPEIEFTTISQRTFDKKIRNVLEDKCQSLIDNNKTFQKYNLYIKYEKKCVGGVIAYIYGKYLWLDAIYINKKQQKLGLGQLLMERIIEDAKSFQLNEIQLNTYFTDAYHFFQKMGFETVAIIPNWKYGLTCYLMRKVLSELPTNFKTLKTEELSTIIYGLESALLNPTIRQSPEILNQIIAEDFIEFSCSGRIYLKKDILQQLSHECERSIRMIDFNIKELANNAVLATYKTAENHAHCLRTSIWKRDTDNWQIIFHQGTRI